VIKSYKSKKLKAAASGDYSKIDPRHQSAVRVVLAALDTAAMEGDFSLPGKRLHQLKQFDPVRWSLDVSANFRITFEWDGCNVHKVDYEDTH
jgi:proteic killer suppression protein